MLSSSCIFWFEKVSGGKRNTTSKLYMGDFSQPSPQHCNMQQEKFVCHLLFLLLASSIYNITNKIPAANKRSRRSSYPPKTKDYILPLWVLPTIRHSKLNSTPSTRAGAAAWSPQTLTSLYRSAQSGRRVKRTSPGDERPSLLSSPSTLPGPTSEVLLAYKWDKVFDDRWLKLKPNSQWVWAAFSARGRKWWRLTVDGLFRNHS